MKRKFAIILAFVLVFTMVTPVFADLPGPGSIVGEGDVEATTIPGPILGGVVPTAGNFNFTIDPLGLLDLEVGNVFDPAAGTTNVVTFGSTATPILGVSNTSSVPTRLSVAMEVTNAARNAAPTGAIVVSTAAAVATAQENNVFFWLEPNRTNLKTAATAAADNFVGAGEVIAFGVYETPVTAQFRLGAIPTQLRVQSVDPVVLTREPVTPGDLNGTAFSFGGVFNQNATWATTVNIGVRVVFTLAALPTEATDIVYRQTTDDVPVANLIATGQHVLTATSGAFTGPALTAKPELIGVTPPPTPPAVGFWGSHPAITITNATTATLYVEDLVGTGDVSVPFVGATGPDVAAIGWMHGDTVLNADFPVSATASAFVLPSNVVEIWVGLDPGTPDIVYQLVVAPVTGDPFVATLTVVFPDA